MAARAGAAVVRRPGPVPPAVGEVVATWHMETCAASRHTRPFTIPWAVWRRGWQALEECGLVVWDAGMGVRTTRWPPNTLREALPPLLAALDRATPRAVVDLDAQPQSGHSTPGSGSRISILHARIC